MKAIYMENKVENPESIFEYLWEHLPWENRTPARREVFFSDKGLPYTYGSGNGVREYFPNPNWDATVKAIQLMAELEFDMNFEACFINGYADQHQALGWHADDSPSIDAGRPILVYSFGAAREIWTRPIDDTKDVTKYTLAPGSLFVMPAGMQQTHVHRIPKHSAPCGPRISLTFRGLV